MHVLDAPAGQAWKEAPSASCLPGPCACARRRTSSCSNASRWLRCSLCSCHIPLGLWGLGCGARSGMPLIHLCKALLCRSARHTGCNTCPEACLGRILLSQVGSLQAATVRCSSSAVSHGQICPVCYHGMLGPACIARAKVFCYAYRDDLGHGRLQYGCCVVAVRISLLQDAYLQISSLACAWQSIMHAQEHEATHLQCSNLCGSPCRSLFAC